MKKKRKPIHFRIEKFNAAAFKKRLRFFVRIDIRRSCSDSSREKVVGWVKQANSGENSEATSPLV
ncbi:hypothetical protein DSM3645_05485 [Blastopirellula marina DSM 3645]|uniref:Uncharacterized protein n=1 Tax=Blastopirellula marina DSM 3645 TaxID=314230 RepID=A3ZTP6_9BACT|nr:hypothetical protein DSM3645_05485 [Blastopirellula marina DSM 3645]